MIAYMKGKVIKKLPTSLIIDVNGLGYLLKVSLHTSSQVQANHIYSLYTHLQIRDDAHTLYGFLYQEEKECFLLLIKINGISGNIALAILSTYTPDVLYTLLKEKNISKISAIKGIGKKLAERMVVELQDKLNHIMYCTDDVISSTTHLAEEAIQALISLGIKKPVAQKMVDELLKQVQHHEDITLEGLIKRALQKL